MADLAYKPALELSRLIHKGDLSPVDLVHHCLERIEKLNPSINAFVSLRPQEALEEAKAIAESLARGKDPGPLAGIPIGVKDLEDVEGLPTTYGSIPFRDNVAVRDSIQVARLKRSGAIVIGKTNTPEFGFTGFTKNRLFGVTRNPWNLERTPGGSSGGSAAAVAAGMVPLATGSDAGGSIRIPACYTGCFGIKPTFGRIPLGPFHRLNTTGLWTLGPLCRTVADAALYLDTASGYHHADPASLPKPGSYLQRIEKKLPRLKICF
ncbi:MAG: amidase, partial [Deltaproteobacteria bacterium]